MWMATMWWSNAVMFVTVRYNKVLFSICIFLTSQSEFDFGIVHVFIIIWKVLVLSMLFISFSNLRNSHSCTTLNLSLLPSPNFPTYISSCMQWYLNLCDRWHFLQWVTSWLLFPRWCAATCSGALLSKASRCLSSICQYICRHGVSFRNT
jgi:hypothetical protein